MSDSLSQNVTSVCVRDRKSVWVLVDKKRTRWLTLDQLPVSPLMVEISALNIDVILDHLKDTLSQSPHSSLLKYSLHVTVIRLS